MERSTNASMRAQRPLMFEQSAMTNSHEISSCESVISLFLVLKVLKGCYGFEEDSLKCYLFSSLLYIVFIILQS